MSPLASLGHNELIERSLDFVEKNEFGEVYSECVRSSHSELLFIEEIKNKYVIIA